MNYHLRHIRRHLRYNSAALVALSLWVLWTLYQDHRTLASHDYVIRQLIQHYSSTQGGASQ